MAARKLQQEVDKCFKKVTEGVAEFDAIYEKIGQSNNTAQKEKLEDNLKREIKKLQRLRDQIKTWAAGNEIKDKGPLMDNRRLIETQMERFKAVEKAMKTKAYSKEGLSAAAKLDPKDQAKHEASEFLSQQVDELEQQIESLEAERESIQATVKRGKLHGAKAERMSRIDAIIDRHKWHQGKLELIRRSLENGGVEVDQVNELDESIRYYVTDGMNDDFMEDESIYDDLNLNDDEDFVGHHEGSSQDNHSIQGDIPEPEPKPTPAPAPPAAAPTAKGRPAAVAEVAASARKTSAQVKSPLPTVATLHTPLPTLSNGSTAAAAGMKPASIPARPAGETLKYASAAAAAAASDKLGLGIAPLPPPISAISGGKNVASATNSPKPATVQLAAASDKAASPAVSAATMAGPSTTTTKAEPTTRTARAKAAAAAAAASPATAPVTTASSSSASAPVAAPTPAAASEPVEPPSKAAAHANGNGTSNGARAAAAASAGPAVSEQAEGDDREEESIYHLPESLRDLVESFEVTVQRNASLQSGQTAAAANGQSVQAQAQTEARLRMLAQSRHNTPEALDSEAARRYSPDSRFSSGSNFPQEPLALLDDPRLYNRVDPDTLFYVFYYKQGTYQQYLAAKALKDMSWRFHKQYQTWFQRHEEPKSITEEFEQGTYRFFDYESTWMNRRKADFKFAYKYLEDDI